MAARASTIRINDGLRWVLLVLHRLAQEVIDLRNLSLQAVQ